jgi:hypothetical protein
MECLGHKRDSVKSTSNDIATKYIATVVHRAEIDEGSGYRVLEAIDELEGACFRGPSFC